MSVLQQFSNVYKDMKMNGIVSNTSYEFDVEYPIFDNPKEYLEFRRGKFIYGFFKRWSERRAMDKCLKGIDDITRVCDVPCGPGRLFKYWQKRKYRVIGVDLSDSFVEAAGKMCKELNQENRVIKGDAFVLKNSLNGYSVDLIAMVRFIYYFDGKERIKLLKSMAELPVKNLLLQYKTNETWRGRRKLKKISLNGRSSTKQYCSNDEIMDELKEAGLECIRIVPIAQASDRVFVMAKKNGMR